VHRFGPARSADRSGDIQRRRAAVDRICYYFRRVLKEYPTSIRRPNGEAAGGYHSISNLFRQSTYVIDAMNATKRIIVREEVWAALSGMREPGMTFSELIEEMIEHEKKRRLLEDIRRIQETEDSWRSHGDGSSFCSGGRQQTSSTTPTLVGSR